MKIVIDRNLLEEEFGDVFCWGVLVILDNAFNLQLFFFSITVLLSFLLSKIF